MQTHLKKTKIIGICFFIFHLQISLGMYKITITTNTEVTRTEQTISTRESYQRKCKKIDSKEKTKIDEFIAHHIKQKDISPYTIIENRLKKQAQNIERIREGNKQKIKDAFAIDHSGWTTIKEIAEQLRIFEDAHKHLPLPNVTHNKNIPKIIRNILKTHLVRLGINPKRITIETNSVNEYSDGCPMPHCRFNRTLILPTDPLACNPGIIDIPETLFSLSLDEQKAAGLLFAHLINSRTFIFYFMLAQSTFLFNATTSHVMSSKPYTRYLEIHKPLGIIELALQNQQNAYFMNYFLKNSYFTSKAKAIYFYRLSAKIKRYWDTLELLDNYHSVLNHKKGSYQRTCYHQRI